MHQFAEPGELLKEFEAEQERLRKEEENRRKDEEKASAELIAQFEQEQVGRIFKSGRMDSLVQRFGTL